MKKLIYISLFLFTVSACNNDITELNTNPKLPLEVSYNTLFSNAQLSLADHITSADVNTNIFRLIVQQWTQTTYLDETRFNLGSRNIPQNFWHPLYRDVIQDVRESKRLLQADKTITDEAVRANRLAMAEIVEVYAWSVLLKTYGDIPYEEALDINNIRPVYQKQQVVYDDLVARLTAAVNSITLSADKYPVLKDDLFYQGDLSKWVKFGNSLKLNLGMTIAGVDPIKAGAIVAEAVAKGVFAGNEDNATLKYSTIPPNTNPIWEDLVQSQRQDFVTTELIIHTLDTLNDPRIDNYFTLNIQGEYVGGSPGFGNAFLSNSRTDTAITETNFPAELMSYSEVEFFLAEATERGFAVGGTPDEHYNKAVTASILSWGGTDAEATAYLSQPLVNYATAGDLTNTTDRYREVIGVQKWLALYNRGFEAWSEWRRLDYPKLDKPNRAFSDIPLRFPYPVSEQNLNTANYTSTVSGMEGGDEVTTRLFWDVK